MTITKVKFANEGLETGWIYIERPELTDEEILSVFVENYGDNILPNVQASGIEFARAILQKASEK